KEEEEVFRDICNIITADPILKFPNLSKLFEIKTDILNYKLEGPRCNYPIYNKKFLIIIEAF
ncbi:hypothetical protein NEUTE2DRAFT_52726, partial [Neurospora tetrasperma FGSC 2509]